jgi:hypothetical protein
VCLSSSIVVSWMSLRSSHLIKDSDSL